MKGEEKMDRKLKIASPDSEKPVRKFLAKLQCAYRDELTEDQKRVYIDEILASFELPPEAYEDLFRVIVRDRMTFPLLPHVIEQIEYEIERLGKYRVEIEGRRKIVTSRNLSLKKPS